MSLCAQQIHGWSNKFSLDDIIRCHEAQCARKDGFETVDSKTQESRQKFNEYFCIKPANKKYSPHNKDLSSQFLTRLSPFRSIPSQLICGAIEVLKNTIREIQERCLYVSFGGGISSEQEMAQICIPAGIAVVILCEYYHFHPDSLTERMKLNSMEFNGLCEIVIGKINSINYINRTYM